MCTMNHGYYVTNNIMGDSTRLQLYSEQYERVCEFDIYYAIPDATEGFVISDTGNMEQYDFRMYFHDGQFLYNYGPKMVFVLGEKDILVDFTLAPGMTAETMDNSIIQAVYDRIYMSDDTYWLATDADGCYYIDHDGNVVAEYEQAIQFYDGYALVLKDGHAYVIDETFTECRDMGEAQEIGGSGEMFAIQNGDDITFYGPEQK